MLVSVSASNLKIYRASNTSPGRLRAFPSRCRSKKFKYRQVLALQIYVTEKTT
jgi:hypothetical protein